MRSPLLARCALLVAWLTLTSQARAEEPVAQHYTIDASFDAHQRVVRGRVDITLTNRTNSALHELLFHLYMNAFRDDESVFMRESGGVLRAQHAKGRGSIEVTSLQVDGVALLDKADGQLVPKDFTQLRVPLARALEPGANARVSIAFETRFPPLFARSGHAGDLLIAGQWYPKLAKLEPDGTFASFPYHALGEFYADFADYDVTLRVPSDHQVGCTGAITSRESKGAQQVLRARAQRVHDFAWVASPSVVVSKRRMHGVDVTFLSPSSYERALVEHMFVVDRGLAQFGKLFGAYPYPTLTVLIPPRGAEGGAGMEYPTLIVSDGSWLPAPFTPSASGAIVTAHELAHQWFYGLLASDEVRHPVLDEGLSEWATLDLMRTLYGKVDQLGAWLDVDRFDWARLFLRGRPLLAPGSAVYEFTPEEYGNSVYGRATLVLETIRRSHGDARFRSALALYARRNRFGHPTPRELAHAFDATYGAGFAERVLLPLLVDGAPSSVSISRAITSKQGAAYATEIQVRRAGVALPTWLRAYDVDGEQLAALPVRDPSRALTLHLATKVPVARLAIDAERSNLLDDEVRDQVWVFTRDRDSALSGKLLAAAQSVLAWLGP